MNVIKEFFVVDNTQAHTQTDNNVQRINRYLMLSLIEKYAVDAQYSMDERMSTRENVNIHT